MCLAKVVVGEVKNLSYYICSYFNVLFLIIWWIIYICSWLHLFVCGLELKKDSCPFIKSLSCKHHLDADFFADVILQTDLLKWWGKKSTWHSYNFSTSTTVYDDLYTAFWLTCAPVISRKDVTWLHWFSTGRGNSCWSFSFPTTCFPQVE